MFRTDLIRKIIHVQRVSIRNKSEPAINIEKLEQESENVDVFDEAARVREEELERKRNKSRLAEPHRNIVHDKTPYSEPRVWIHGTLSYARKMYGRYGAESGVDPSLCWPTPKELADRVEYERVAHPYTIMEMANAAIQKRQEKEDAIHARQMDIAKKMEKLEHFKRELRNQVAKKEADAMAAKQRKAQLIEDVRRHFGYTVDPKDDKFKEMLEKKEKEQKKVLKEAKRKAKEEKMIAMLLNKKVDIQEPAAEKKESKE